MQLETLGNRSLKISMQRGDKHLIKDLLVRHGGDDIMFMSDLLDQTGWLGNGILHLVKPEDIGALTGAPIVSDDITTDDHGSVTVLGNVWRYPGYEIKHFATDMLQNGFTIFQASGSAGEQAS